MTETLFPVDYTSFYRWEWFRRATWQREFRVRKRASAGGFVEWAKRRGLEAETFLDSSCGLGLKTIVMREGGLRVQGSDVCPLAVELARRLADEERHPEVEYFVSAWADLPARAPTRYAAVFNDALAWVYSEDAMAASLRGFHDVLMPGGALVYMGATPESRGETAELLEAEWQRTLTEQGVCSVGWRHADRGTSVTQLQLNQKGHDYVDRHHVYLIEGLDGALRTEGMTVRRALKWQWPVMEPFLRAAGFVAFGTHAFRADNGRDFSLVIAERD